MSRAFVKDGEQPFDDLPDRVIPEHPNDVTREGMAQIEAALAAAKHDFAAAQAGDDRGAMASASRDLRYWSSRRATARIVPDPSDNSQVRFGSSVTIARDDGRKQTFRIVGEDEADPSRGTISHVSPLARQLFGKGVGEVVRVGAGEAEILAIGLLVQAMRLESSRVPDLRCITKEVLHRVRYTRARYAAALCRASSALYSSNSSAEAFAMLGRARSRS